MEERGKWFEHKRKLIELGLVHPVFAELSQVSFVPDPNHEFEPLLVARHSQRIGELVDRCLTIRKDIRELEVLQVKAATDYELFKSTSTLDEQMDVLRLQMPSKACDELGFQKAAAAFASAVTLEKGLGEIAKGRREALGEDLKSSKSIQDLITTRWDDLRAYQDAYHARYIEPGNAHNYGERATLLLEVLTVLMQEALARAVALTAGVKRVYGVQLADVPPIVTLQTIDRFAVWALKTIQSLSRAAEEETPSEVIIPLVQPWLPSQQPLIKQADFDRVVAGAAGGQPVSLSFDLPNNSILDPRTRLKGLGLSFGNEFNIVPGSGIDRNETVDAFTRLTASVTTPAQVGDDGISYHRPQALIGNVGLHGAGGGASLVEGTSIENISPFGTWKIDIHPLFVWKDAKKQFISSPNFSSPIRDLKLALRLYVPGPFAGRETSRRVVEKAGAGI